jgi:hypothetical protein
MIYRYRIFEADGSDAGEAHYAVRIAAGEIVWTGDGRTFRVIDVVATEDASDEYVGTLSVEAA